ncbi:MAG: ELM1/GtrOC1 family putative glycosyltransferase [Akkermansia sp.]
MSLMKIRVLSDSKPGHISQSMGLAQALVEQGGGDISVVDISGKGFFSRLQLARSKQTPFPDLIIAAGHLTHLPLIYAARLCHALSILCMSPTLPCCFFDVCLIPRHDLTAKKITSSSHVFRTIGAINSIQPCSQTLKKNTLILIGGPSKEFLWDTSHLIEQLISIAQLNNSIILTTSRRTPNDVVNAIKIACPHIKVVPVEETQKGWMEEHLATAESIWVTEDSVSMIYESLGTGVPVGILGVPRKHNSPSRVAKGLSMLIDEKRVTRWQDWQLTHQLLPQTDILNESHRAARYIIQRFPQLLHS